MESSSPSSSGRPLHTPPKPTPTPTPTRQNPPPNRIHSSIRGKSCPICLTHIDNRTAAVITTCLHAYCIGCIRKWSHVKRKCPLCNLDFDSWFFKIDPCSRTFRKEKLPGLGEGRKVITTEGLRRRANHRLVEQRVIRRSREEFNGFNGRTRPSPRQRWFQRSESESSDAVAQRVLLWRASIYEQHLQAVPFSSRSYQEQNMTRKYNAKERIEEKIEPWIRRELVAILGDPDPTVIVHVASSLFMSSFEVKHEASFEQSDLVDNHLEPLRPFLHERTNMFWHELRCFAESPFNMETYDTVVKYRKWSE